MYFFFGGGGGFGVGLHNDKCLSAMNIKSGMMDIKSIYPSNFYTCISLKAHNKKNKNE